MESIKMFMARHPQVTKTVKVVVLVLVGLVVLNFIIGIFRMQGLVQGPFFNLATKGVSQGMPGGFGGGNMVYSEAAYDTDDGYGYGEATLSVRNVAGSMIVPPVPSFPSSGNTQEEYEVTEYSASYEVGNATKTCGAIQNLKVRTDVIFENSNESEKYCNFTFKVEKESVSEIVGILNELDPENLNENTYTIKRTIDDFTSQTDILEERLRVIDSSLRDAIAQYDAISRLATGAQDIETLAKVIDSKLSLIERLTRERLNASSQLEEVIRAKDNQLDLLLYSRFYVSVYENKYVDGDGLMDAWKRQVQSFVRDLNGLVMQLTLGLINFILSVVVYALYLLVLVLVVKYSWKFVVKIWRQ